MSINIQLVFKRLTKYLIGEVYQCKERHLKYVGVVNDTD